MLLWETKETSSGTTYTPRKSPSSYKIDWEDLDKNSYRSITSGNLIDTVISKSWTKIGFNYNCLSEAEIQALLPLLATNPLYVKAKNPVFGNEYVEMEMRCSRKSAEMLETGDYTLSFNLVQKKKVSGQ
jgi:hypothetical protein